MKRRTVRAIRHVSFEDLGSFETALTEAGYDIDYVDAADGGIAALDPLGYDLLAVLGGPVGVYDDAAYPVLADELRLIHARIEADRPTLGICLGAQLIAAALGARVYPGPTKEIGWSRLELTERGRARPLVSLRETPVLNWHADTFDLPDGCELLASTGQYRNQAFSRGPNLLALQFHAEPLAGRFEHWLFGHASELHASGMDPALLRADAHRYAQPLAAAARALVERWIADVR